MYVINAAIGAAHARVLSQTCEILVSLSGGSVRDTCLHSRKKITLLILFLFIARVLHLPLVALERHFDGLDRLQLFPAKVCNFRLPGRLNFPG